MTCRGNQVQAPKGPFLMESHRAGFISPTISCDNMGNVYREAPWRLSPEFLLGAGHLGTLCLGWSQIADFQRKSRCSARITYFRTNRHSEPLLLFGDSGNPPQIQVPRCQPRANLGNGLFQGQLTLASRAGSFQHTIPQAGA